jgi:TatD DNase family protein
VTLFDVHAHLTHEQLIGDIPGVLERARSAGVTTVISNGLNPEDNANVARLAAEHEMVKPAFGLYPVDAVLEQMRAAGLDYPGQRAAWPTHDAIDWVREHADQAIAIGEIGLDGYWVPEPFWAAQDAAFMELVQLAIAKDKPIIIHSRKREPRTFELLQQVRAPRVNWHCYSSKLKLAERIAAAGHYLSIPANARRSETFTRMLTTLPRTQLLLETDCPYLGPDKEKPNEPANVRGTLNYAAELWNVTCEEAEAQFTENFTSLFGVAP